MTESSRHYRKKTSVHCPPLLSVKYLLQMVPSFFTMSCGHLVLSHPVLSGFAIQSIQSNLFGKRNI